jgi:hypothetical protein
VMKHKGSNHPSLPQLVSSLLSQVLSPFSLSPFFPPALRHRITSVILIPTDRSLQELIPADTQYYSLP